MFGFDDDFVVCKQPELDLQPPFITTACHQRADGSITARNQKVRSWLAAQELPNFFQLPVDD